MAKSDVVRKRGLRTLIERLFHNPLHILVVEDDPLLAEMVRTMLLRNGYEVTLVQDGYHAVKMARKTHPDLVLCDLALPEFSGLDVARYLKEDPRTRDIPLIAMSAHSHETLYQDVDAAGFVFLLRKPFGIEQLLDALKHVFPQER